jgi:hypothetical protein
MPLFAKAGVSPIVIRDENGMPRCLQHPTRNSQSVLLYWDNSLEYRRVVYAVGIHDLPRPGLFSCQAWRLGQQMANQAMHRRELKYLDPAAHEIYGLDLDNETLQALAQIRLGGSVYRSEQSIGEFLQHHPIAHYDRAENLRLTQKYGPGFSGEVFRFIRESRPQNQFARAQLLKYLESRAMPSLALHLQNQRVLIFKGYLENPQQSRVHALHMTLQNLGVRVQALDADSTAAIPVNRRWYAEQLRRHLQAGEHLILLGASKGVPEMLGAVVDLSHQHFPGRVDAVISMSGTMAGSFLVDWALHPLLRPIIQTLIWKEAEESGIHVGDVGPGLESQSTPALGAYMEGLRPYLPQDLVYLEVVGIPSDNDLAPDPFIRSLQTGLMESSIFPFHGASDGLIEFPGTQMDPSWVSRLYQLTFDASHSIADGSFAGYSMKDPAQYARVIQAVFHFVADQVEQPPPILSSN